MALVEDTWLLTLHVRRVKMKEYKLNLDLVNLSAQNPLPTWFELYIPGKWNLKEDVIELKEELALDSSEYVTVLNKSCPAADLSTIIIPFRILVKLEKQSVGSVSWRVLRKAMWPRVGGTSDYSRSTPGQNEASGSAISWSQNSAFPPTSSAASVSSVARHLNLQTDQLFTHARSSPWSRGCI